MNKDLLLATLIKSELISVALTAVVVLAMVIKLVTSCEFHKSCSSTCNRNTAGDELAVTLTAVVIIATVIQLVMS